jgi:hypothetical protein
VEENELARSSVELKEAECRDEESATAVSVALARSASFHVGNRAVAARSSARTGATLLLAVGASLLAALSSRSARASGP